METLKENRIVDFKHLVNASPLSHKYKKLWDTLYALGYKEEDIRAAIADKITNDKKELTEFHFYLFFDQKIILVKKGLETLEYDITEFKSPVIRKQISTTYRETDEKKITLFLQDGQHFTWSTGDIYKYSDDHEAANKTIIDVYKMY